jgi:hypothetical protein
MSLGGTGQIQMSSVRTPSPRRSTQHQFSVSMLRTFAIAISSMWSPVRPNPNYKYALHHCLNCEITILSRIAMPGLRNSSGHCRCLGLPSTLAYLRERSKESFRNLKQTWKETQNIETRDAWKVRLAAAANLPLDPAAQKKMEILELLVPAWRSEAVRCRCCYIFTLCV